MSPEDDVFRRLKRSSWKQAWDDYIIAGPESLSDALHKNGWTMAEFINHGLENGYIEKDENE